MGCAPSLLPKTVGNLQPRLSPKAHEVSPSGAVSQNLVGHLQLHFHRSEQAAVPQHVRAPSSLGTAHPQPPKPAHLSCINDISFIFPSPWRGLGAESRAQTVSLALRECWHRDIQESRHVLPAWGSTRARHGARPEGCGMIQGTVSKRDSRRTEPGCPQISPSRRCWSDALVRQG